MTRNLTKVRAIHQAKHHKTEPRMPFPFVVPSPPRSPSVYLTLHPWTLPEYLQLLSIKPLGSKTDNMPWDEVANKLNSATRHQPRSAWDCWHRWMVPWRRPEHPSKPRPNTYPHAPGVQHEYKFSDFEGLIGLWTCLSSAIGTSYGVSSPPAFPEPTIPAVHPCRAGGRAHHPGAHHAHFSHAHGLLRAIKRIRCYPCLRMCPRVPWAMPVITG